MFWDYDQILSEMTEEKAQNFLVFLDKKIEFFQKTYEAEGTVGNSLSLESFVRARRLFLKSKWRKNLCLDWYL